MRIIILALLFFYPLTAAAELNVSYEVGGVFIASYQVSEINAGSNVTLASVEEYDLLNADKPEFLNDLNVVKRKSDSTELFISSATISSDRSFDMVFVNSNSRNVVDWFSVTTVNGGVQVAENYKHPQKNRAQKHQIFEPDNLLNYNSGNREVVALLSEVARQLSAVQNETLQEEIAFDRNGQSIAPVSLGDTPVSLGDTPVSLGDPVVIVGRDKGVKVQLDSSANMRSNNSNAATDIKAPYNNREIISEVHLATANMQNFILTILTLLGALIITAGTVLIKTKAHITNVMAPKDQREFTNAANDTSSDQLPELFSYLRDESKRNQETYLKSIEFLSRSSSQNQGLEQPDKQTTSKRTMPINNPNTQKAKVPPAFGPQIAQTTNQKEENALTQRSQPLNRNIPDRKSVKSETQNQKNSATDLRPQVSEKINLARVYHEMGDVFAAQDILREITKSGNPVEVEAANLTIKELEAKK